MNNSRGNIFERAKYEQKIVQLEQNYIVQLRDGRIGFVTTNNTGYDHWNNLAQRMDYEVVRLCIYVPTSYNSLTRVHKGEDYFLKNYTRGLYHGEYGHEYRNLDVMKIKENTAPSSLDRASRGKHSRLWVGLCARRENKKLAISSRLGTVWLVVEKKEGYLMIRTTENIKEYWENLSQYFEKKKEKEIKENGNKEKIKN